MFFKMQSSETTIFQLFSTIAIVGANDDRRQCFSQNWLVKRANKWVKKKKSEYYFLLKLGFNHRFLMFFQVSTIVNYYFRCFLHVTIKNNFFRPFPTILTIAIVGANDDRRRAFAQVYS